ncbi:MAG TPA: hypothetical protein VJ975_10095, partial [Candidatus Limnocylindria bacterium]|nr:hypothetical protein [Candidatus Limnocylindria bacterium]
MLGVLWSTGGIGYPFGPEYDPSPHLSILGDAPRDIVAPAIAVLGFLGFGVAIAMLRIRHRGALALLAAAFGTMAAIGLAILIPDYRILVVLAYLPILVVTAPFGLLPETDLLAVLTWPVINQLVCIVGGCLWAAASLAFWRRTGGACEACGRTDTPAGWTSAEHARSWGRVATGVAVAVPLVYAATRWTWALGFSVGIDHEFYRHGLEIGLWTAGALLGTLAVLGGVITLGLVQRWGEVIPGWIPFVGGRRVPVMLAVVPAGLVAAIVTSAGLMFWRFMLRGGFELGGFLISFENSWAAVLPELLWPIWGVALACAALAYSLRRRGRCRICGR